MTSLETNNKIISSVKKFPGTDRFFEQRGTNIHEQSVFYFNQPVIKYPIKPGSDRKWLNQVSDRMRQSMNEAGIGLAHNQLTKETYIDNPFAIFTIETEKLGVPYTVFVNPVIVGVSDDLVGYYHGCLSAIGTNRAKVTTYQEILMIFYDMDLKLVVKKFTGMSAIICQHEFNHLTTGGTYVDTVNFCMNGDRFVSATEAFVPDDVIKDRNDYGKIFKVTPDENLPCLIRDHVLKRCKHELLSNPSYETLIHTHFQSHPGDRQLHQNLLSYPDTHLSLYYSPSQPFTLEF